MIEETAPRFRSRRSSDFDGGESSVGRKEAANLHRARHVRTRITGMSFGSSYFTLLRATMIGLSAQAPLALPNPRVSLTRSRVLPQRTSVSSSTSSLLSPFETFSSSSEEEEEEDEQEGPLGIVRSRSLVTRDSCDPDDP
ncbi:hypothetical protein ALC53_09531 [Atta colombica]|uniref:Uncharacterized protein n=1 Tax=Atta colombica TaxID=520822 RepID=A0A195B6W7_9HYME|nr:hypothetical protein ALC53_09531 [Atta colombica]